MMREEKSRQHYTFERRVDNISLDPQLRLRAQLGQTASLYIPMKYVGTFSSMFTYKCTFSLTKDSRRHLMQVTLLQTS